MKNQVNSQVVSWYFSITNNQKMKKILAIMILSLCTKLAFSCDVCSSSGTNSLNGQLLQNNVSFVGLSWNNSIMTGDIERKYSTHFSNLIGGYAFKEKWQIMATLPFQYQIRKQSEVKTTEIGLGDAMLLTTFQAFNSKIIKPANHKLYTTAGIKLPTGNYDSFSPEFAPLGSGSLDWVLAAQHIFERKKKGINNRFDTQLNMKNSNGFRYGNVYRISSFAFIKKEVKKTILMPFAGASSEFFGKNSSNGFVREASGGIATFAFLGLQTMINEKYTFFVRGEMPVYQKLESFDGPIEISYRLQAQFTILFNKKPKVTNNNTIEILSPSN